MVMLSVYDLALRERVDASVVRSGTRMVTYGLEGNEASLPPSSLGVFQDGRIVLMKEVMEKDLRGTKKQLQTLREIAVVGADMVVQPLVAYLAHEDRKVVRLVHCLLRTTCSRHQFLCDHPHLGSTSSAVAAASAPSDISPTPDLMAVTRTVRSEMESTHTWRKFCAILTASILTPRPTTPPRVSVDSTAQPNAEVTNEGDTFAADVRALFKHTTSNVTSKKRSRSLFSRKQNVNAASPIQMASLSVLVSRGDKEVDILETCVDCLASKEPQLSRQSLALILSLAEKNHARVAAVLTPYLPSPGSSTSTLDSIGKAYMCMIAYKVLCGDTKSRGGSLSTDTSAALQPYWVCLKHLVMDQADLVSLKAIEVVSNLTWQELAKTQVAIKTDTTSANVPIVSVMVSRIVDGLKSTNQPTLHASIRIVRKLCKAYVIWDTSLDEIDSVGDSPRSSRSFAKSIRSSSERPSSVASANSGTSSQQHLAALWPTLLPLLSSTSIHIRYAALQTLLWCVQPFAERVPIVREAITKEIQSSRPPPHLLHALVDTMVEVIRHGNMLHLCLPDVCLDIIKAEPTSCPMEAIGRLWSYFGNDDANKSAVLKILHRAMDICSSDEGAQRYRQLSAALVEYIGHNAAKLCKDSEESDEPEVARGMLSLLLRLRHMISFGLSEEESMAAVVALGRIGIRSSWLTAEHVLGILQRVERDTPSLGYLVIPIANVLSLVIEKRQEFITMLQSQEEASKDDLCQETTYRLHTLLSTKINLFVDTVPTSFLPLGKASRPILAAYWERTFNT